MNDCERDLLRERGAFYSLLLTLIDKWSSLEDSGFDYGIIPSVVFVLPQIL